MWNKFVIKEFSRQDGFRKEMSPFLTSCHDTLKSQELLMRCIFKSSLITFNAVLFHSREADSGCVTDSAAEVESNCTYIFRYLYFTVVFTFHFWPLYLNTTLKSAFYVSFNTFLRGIIGGLILHHCSHCSKPRSICMGQYHKEILISAYHI